VVFYAVANGVSYRNAVRFFAVLVVTLAVGASGVAWAHPGSLDTSFGHKGLALTPVRERNEAVGYLEARSWLHNIVAVATMRGGRVVVAGERTVAVFRRDGRIDRRFGNNGRVNLPTPGGGETIIKDVAVDPSGRIVVLAAVRLPNDGGLVIVGVLSPTGMFDNSFADRGILLTDFGLPAPQPMGPGATPGTPNDVLPTGLAIDGQGRIVIGGTTIAAISYCRDGGDQPRHAAYLARLQPDGSLDPSFGNGGVVLDERHPFYIEQHPFMGGIAVDGPSVYYTTDRNDAASCEGFGGGLLVRLNEAGDRDPSFGSGGVLDVTPPESRARQIAIDRWGRVLLLRYAGGFYVVSRWNPDGTLDTDFGHGGEIAVKRPGEESGFEAMAVDGRGRPLLAGRIAPSRTPFQAKHHIFPPPKFALIRLDSSGRSDRSFGKGGRVVTGFGRGSRAVATDIAISGKKAILAGPILSSRIQPRQGFGLARYQLGP
jgi:uncharacterized delta-60 repeat protein